MKYNNSIPLKIKTMTPVFIGNSETLKPLSYVVDRNFIKVIDQDKFFDTLTQDEKRQYFNWIDPILSEIASQKEKVKLADGDYDQQRQYRREQRKFETKLSIEDFITNVLHYSLGDFLR